MDIKTNKHINYKKSVDEAFILAAGLGRRLMPLTKKCQNPWLKLTKNQ